MSEYITIYHLDSQYTDTDTKTGNLLHKIQDRSGVSKYYGLQKYWGNIIVFNQRERSRDKYAHLISPDGVKCNTITKSMFDKFNSLDGTKHEYIDRIKSREFDSIKSKLKQMSHSQLQEILYTITDQNKEYEICGNEKVLIIDEFPYIRIEIESYSYIFNLKACLTSSQLLSNILNIYSKSWCTPNVLYNIIQILNKISKQKLGRELCDSFCPSGCTVQVTWP